MHGTLSEATIEQMLQNHRWGRLGFCLGQELFIVPINYAYDGQYLYGQAAQGMKVDAMRQNPHVAFEIDEIEDPAHWRTVLVHGQFSELHERAEKERAFQRILAQAGGGERSEVTWAMGIDHLVVFKITIRDRSGRFEQREAYSLGAVQRRD